MTRKEVDYRDSAPLQTYILHENFDNLQDTLVDRVGDGLEDNLETIRDRLYKCGSVMYRAVQ